MAVVSSGEKNYPTKFMKLALFYLGLLILAISLRGAESTALDVWPNRASGVYRVGESVT
mgnify:CR=1 FL=1